MLLFFKHDSNRTFFLEFLFYRIINIYAVFIIIIIIIIMPVRFCYIFG